jgi:hypothetical protein
MQGQRCRAESQAARQTATGGDERCRKHLAYRLLPGRLGSASSTWGQFTVQRVTQPPQIGNT